MGKIINIYVLVCLHLMMVQNSWAFVPDGKLSPELLAKAEDARERAMDWLTTQRHEDFGWGEDTAKVIVAFASSIPNWPEKSDLEARLSANQLEVELLASLLRHISEPVTPAHTAYFFVALNAICKDPYDFYGHNLIELIAKQQKDQDYAGFTDTFGYALSSLATCLGETHIRKRQTRHLFQLLHKYESVETRALASLTLECIHHSRNSETLKRHLHEGLETLGGMQMPDGSFGDIHATAMAIQSLGSIEEAKNFWNKTSALIALISMQNPSGGFNEDIPTTVHAILGFSALVDGTGLLTFKRHRCNPDPVTESVVRLTTLKEVSTSTSTEHNTKSSSTTLSAETHTEYILDKSTASLSPEDVFAPLFANYTPPVEKIMVNYWLWIGPQPATAEKYNITVQVPYNSTFYKVMQKAAEEAPIYEFSSAIWPNGHYVHTISGHREQPSGYNYWLLYRLPGEPDSKSPPGPEFVAPAGVDELLVHDGETYLFWFKKI